MPDSQIVSVLSYLCGYVPFLSNVPQVKFANRGHASAKYFLGGAGEPNKRRGKKKSYIWSSTWCRDKSWSDTSDRYLIFQ